MAKNVPPARASVIFLIGQDSGEPRILARRTSTSKLVLPGGKAETLENPVGTALRECWEETGIFLDSNRIDTLTTRHFGFRLVTYHIASYQAKYGAPSGLTVWVSREHYLAHSQFPDDDAAVLRGVKLYPYAYDASPVQTTPLEMLMQATA